MSVVSSRPRRSRGATPEGFWVVWTTVALDLVGFGIVVPILGRYAERFGASGVQVGLSNYAGVIVLEEGGRAVAPVVSVGGEL